MLNQDKYKTAEERVKAFGEFCNNHNCYDCELINKGRFQYECMPYWLALDAEKVRHTDDYKDERIRTQDAEIATLKGDMTELCKCLKEAVDFHCGKCINKGGPCNKDCLFDRWNKALEGANAQVAEGGEK